MAKVMPESPGRSGIPT